VTPAEARQTITARIVALTVDPGYQQSNTDAWTESKVPLVPELTPEPAAHLSFFVDNRRISLLQTRQNASQDLLINAPVTIRFLYRMRASNRVGDWDGADAARVALWKWLLNGWEETYGLNINPSEPDLSTFQVIGDWIAVSLTIVCTYYSEAV
jgi:hypothetical protein